MAPLPIPLIVGPILRSEEVIDAMDLRGFGTGPRTWYEKLTYHGLDYVLLVFSVLLIISMTLLNLLGYGDLWVPEQLIALAS